MRIKAFTSTYGLLRRILPLLVITLFLHACIVVQDFAGYWDKGIIDVCINSIVRGGPPTGDVTDESPVAIRSLRIGDHTFLMMRERQGDKGGNLMRYEIRDGQFISYRLNENSKADFLRRFPKSPVIIDNETATIPLLNNESIGLLKIIAADKRYWVESSREPYNPDRRNDCVRAPY